MKQEALTKEDMELLTRYGLAELPLQGVFAELVKKGGLLCMQEQPLTRLMLMAKGRAKVSIGAAHGGACLMAFFDQEGIIGDLELMNGNENASTTVQALCETRLIVFPFSLYREALLINNTFLRIIATTLAKKLSARSVNSARFVLYPLKTRLMAYLSMAAEKGVFTEKLTELSELLGVSYRHLHRTLLELVEEGILKKERRGYAVLREDALLSAREQAGYYLF